MAFFHANGWSSLFHTFVATKMFLPLFYAGLDVVIRDVLAPWFHDDRHSGQSDHLKLSKHALCEKGLSRFKSNAFMSSY